MSKFNLNKLTIDEARYILTSHKNGVVEQSPEYLMRSLAVVLAHNPKTRWGKENPNEFIHPRYYLTSRDVSVYGDTNEDLV